MDFTLPYVMYHVGLHLAGDKTNVAIETIWETTKKFLTTEEKPINHHLQRAARDSFLAAQQDIARDCHKELITDSSLQEFVGTLAYLPPHREELKWLDTKVKETAKQLGQLRRDKTVADEFVDRNDLESLCTPEGKLAEARIVALKQRLIEEALTDCHSRCYQYKVETELFEQVSDRFMAAIRENPEVSRVFNARWLTQISAIGQEVKQKVERLEEQMSQLFSIVLKLDGSVENMNNVVLAKILKELQQLTKDSSMTINRMREGSIVLVLQGSREGVERLKAENLKEIAGFQVEGVLEVSSEWEDEKPAHVNRPISFTKLAAWLLNVFSEGWLPADELAFACARSIRRMENARKIERGTQIELGDVPPLTLLVSLLPHAENREIELYLYPTKGTLPAGLQFMVLDEQDKPVEGLSIVLESGQDAAKLSLAGRPGELFTVKLVLGEKSVVRHFEI
jgi:Protein of unknown function (DUF1822)